MQASGVVLAHTVLSTCLALSATRSEPARAGEPEDSVPGGLFLLRGESIGNWNAQQLEHVTAFALRPAWADLQPAADRYHWDGLREAIRTAVDTHGKKVTLLVLAGSLAPGWLYDVPHAVPRFIFLEESQQGITSESSMPLPWNETYLSMYERLISEMASQIQAMGVSSRHRPYWDEILLLHVSGPSNGVEMFIPKADNGGIDPRSNPIQGFPGGTSHDYRAEWAAAGYTPRRAYDAYRRVIDFYAVGFPEKHIALDTSGTYLNGNERLDADGDGQEETYAGGVVDAIVDYGVLALSARLTLQLDALNDQELGRYDYEHVLEYHRLADRTIVGFQTWVPGKRVVRKGDYRQFILNGLNRGARYLEIFGPDLLEFPEVARLAAEHWANVPGRDTPPSPVTEFLVRPAGDGVLELDFVAPGEDWDEETSLSYGAVAAYEVRVSEAPIVTEADFEGAKAVVQAWRPAYTGRREGDGSSIGNGRYVFRKEIAGLIPGTNYYVAIRVVDDAGQKSTIVSAQGVPGGNRLPEIISAPWADPPRIHLEGFHP